MRAPEMSKPQQLELLYGKCGVEVLEIIFSQPDQAYIAGVTRILHERHGPEYTNALRVGYIFSRLVSAGIITAFPDQEPHKGIYHYPTFLGAFYLELRTGRSTVDFRNRITVKDALFNFGIVEDHDEVWSSWAVNGLIGILNRAGIMTVTELKERIVEVRSLPYIGPARLSLLDNFMEQFWVKAS